MPISTNQQFEQASIYSDLNSLNSIREQGLSDEVGAIKKAAKEFEAFFMNMMLKSMRQASESIGKNDLTGSSEEKMFVGMMDEQMAADLSQKGHLGIADLMLSQLQQRYKSSDDNKTERSAAKVMEDYRSVPIMTSDGASPQSMTIESAVPVHKKNSEKSVLNTAYPKKSELKLLNMEKVETRKATESKENEVKPEKKPLFDEVSEFITTLLPFAKKAAEKLSVDPRLLLAQAALETGWGKFIMHDKSGKPGFNLFGIKAGADWQGDSIKIDTLEVENQEFKKVNASFRKYQGFSESFDDYVNFLEKNPRYQKALESSHSSKDFVKELQVSGYATDPNYAKKIMRIFKQTQVHSTNVGTK